MPQRGGPREGICPPTPLIMTTQKEKKLHKYHGFDLTDFEYSV